MRQRELKSFLKVNKWLCEMISCNTDWRTVFYQSGNLKIFGILCLTNLTEMIYCAVCFHMGFDPFVNFAPFVCLCKENPDMVVCFWICSFLWWISTRLNISRFWKLQVRCITLKTRWIYVINISFQSCSTFTVLHLCHFIISDRIGFHICVVSLLSMCLLLLVANWISQWIINWTEQDKKVVILKLPELHCIRYLYTGYYMWESTPFLSDSTVCK